MSQMEEKLSQLEAKLISLEQEKNALKLEVHTQAKKGRSFRRVTMLVVSIVLAIGLVAGASSYLMAQSTPLVYSGYLEKAGKPLSGKHTVTIALHKTSTDKTALCSQTHNNIIFVKGRFRVPLPSNCAVLPRQNSELWVQVSVDSVPLSRQRLTASPYATFANAKPGIFTAIPKTTWTQSKTSTSPNGFEFYAHSDTFDLPYDALVVATATAQISGSTNALCSIAIGFGTDVNGKLNGFLASLPFSPNGGYVTNLPKPVSTTRYKFLTKGKSKAIHLRAFVKGGQCNISQMAIQGFYIPIR